MSIYEQLENLKKLQLAKDEFVVVSSGALAIRGIREAKDIDVIVTQSLWNELIKTYTVSLNDWGIENICLKDDIEILNPTQSIFGNSSIIPIGEIFSKADIFDDIRFINLEQLKKIKSKMGREIDLLDVKFIDQYLNLKR